MSSISLQIVQEKIYVYVYGEREKQMPNVHDGYKGYMGVFCTILITLYVYNYFIIKKN